MAFDRLFNSRKDYTDMQFDFVIKEMRIDKGAFSPDMFELVEKCRYEIINFYKGLDV